MIFFFNTPVLSFYAFSLEGVDADLLYIVTFTIAILCFVF